ncbi:phosphoribosylformylglycinamidine cyclo-ligase [Caloramator fervidus]|uniref:Phosphoribosylformylglycinamidine cyclo-ligase n=1 Tax=Caloramator fervidus TaxID=29344 RepID=A0A1H5RRZ1_9CLOT|nr:phosphoribosylformylglycinamidine cyclo-ligase [Caloramator fervidus]SEF41126.1 phosphoribosylformylglycinamidine cyclo-ligase [Caloramator fervidus]
MKYKDAGVNIQEGYKAVKFIKEHALGTYNDRVLSGIGSFSALYDISGYKNPLLVSGADGVGTKLKIAFKMGIYDTVGIDCVAMCVNDILCCGATPLFFLDYIACGKLDAEIVSLIVSGIAKGCKMAGCSLIGGETAEMPDFYQEGDYDIAGFAVGIVEKDRIVDGSSIEDGDLLIGIESSGCHSNGYSLIRKLIKDLDKDFEGRKIGEVLLEPTTIYVPYVLPLLQKYKIKGMAHITGGGFYENIPRMFKEDFTAVIDKESFEIPSIFKYIMSLGVEEKEMFNTFNMGIGFVLCVERGSEEYILDELNFMGKKAFVIGHVEKGGGGVCIE